MVVQQAGRRNAVVPFALAVVCAIVCLFCPGSSLRHESGAVIPLLDQTVMTVVQTHFHGAKSIYMILPKILEALKPYGLRPKVVMCGVSICPDDISNEKTFLSTLLTNYYGKAFPTGGLGGVPFVGKTGVMASHHEPTDGHVVVFGPHIGLSPDGELSKLVHIGQAAVSTACAAASAGYGQLTSGETVKADTADAQLCWRGEEQLAPEIEKFVKATERVVALNFKLYKIIEEQMLNVVNTQYGAGKVVLLGGITINMPHPMPGYFLPLHFSIRSEGQAPVDLMRSFM